MDCSDAFDMVIANLDGRIEFLERVTARLESQSDESPTIQAEIETLKSVKSSVVEYKRICVDKDTILYKVTREDKETQLRW